jgi:hypothetical protein
VDGIGRGLRPPVINSSRSNPATHLIFLKAPCLPDMQLPLEWDNKACADIVVQIDRQFKVEMD